MKTYLNFLYLFISITIFSCDSTDSAISNLTASFELLSEEVFIDNAVSFTNTSSGLEQSTVYSWDFGDGKTSSQKNPTHIFTEIGDGIYEVALKVSNNGRENSFSKEITVNYTDEITGRKTLLEKLATQKILTCAHRGYHENNSENSLTSIEEAIKEEIEMVEIDIRQSKDGHLILMHDETLNRTTNATGKVRDYTLEELNQFKLKNNRGVVTNEKIPTLKEALVVGRGKIYFDLDISDGKVSFESIYQVVKQYGMIKQVLFYTQGLSVTKSALNKDSDIIAMPIINDENRLSQYEVMDNVKVVHFQSQTFNQALVNRAKAKGWYIFMNAYINSSKSPLDDNYNEVNRIITLAGNIIQTDYPVLVKEHLN